jgi:hypothetical protein
MIQNYLLKTMMIHLIFIKNMALDQHNCYYCIKNHTSYENIENILKTHNDSRQNNMTISRLYLTICGESCLFL